jgi:hypothetical protein
MLQGKLLALKIYKEILFIPSLVQLYLAEASAAFLFSTDG